MNHEYPNNLYELVEGGHFEVMIAFILQKSHDPVFKLRIVHCFFLENRNLIQFIIKML